jgi:hypothetical protein
MHQRFCCQHLSTSAEEEARDEDAHALFAPCLNLLHLASASNQIRINQKSRELPCRLMMRYPRNRTTITTHTCACQETKTASSPLVLEDTRGPFTCTQQGHHSYHDLLSSINRMQHFEQREHHQSLTSCLLTTSVCTNIDG